MLDDVEADVVIGFGGYVAAPPTWRLVVACAGGGSGGHHEANARAGPANRMVPAWRAGCCRRCRVWSAPRRGGGYAGSRIDHGPGSGGVARPGA